MVQDQPEAGVQVKAQDYCVYVFLPACELNAPGNSWQFAVQPLPCDGQPHLDAEQGQPEVEVGDVDAIDADTHAARFDDGEYQDMLA